MPPITLSGIVTKVGFMNKTATVTVSNWYTHPKTMKRLLRHKKYLTHDPNNMLRQDDQVVIQNCPPVSKRKRFTLHKILKSPDQEREARHSPEAAAELARIKEASKGKRIEETLKVTTF